MSRLKGYIGTYASPESRGIYRFTMDCDTGALSAPELYYEAPDCKYLSMYHGLLAAPVKRDQKAGVCLLDTGGEGARPLGEAGPEDKTPCFVIQDESRIYTANYHEGNVLVYEKMPDGLELVKRIDIAPKAGCHQILFHGHLLMVPCLLLDQVRIFDMDREFAPAGQLTFPKGTGPRHGVFNQNHERLYLVSELSNRLFVYQVLDQSGGPDSFRLLETLNLLPEDAEYSEPPASAAIRLSPDERRLYVSTRFAEVITVFDLSDGRVKQIQQTGCGGIHPRDFVLTADGRFLLVVNRTDGSLVSFRLDPGDGRLLETCSRVPAPEAVGIVLGEAGA